MWINSMFFVPTFFSYLCILLPKSAPFVWLFYRKIVFVKDSYSKHFDEPGLAGFFFCAIWKMMLRRTLRQPVLYL